LRVIGEDGRQLGILSKAEALKVAHKELGFQLAEKVIEQLGEDISVDQAPQFAGRQLNFVIRSNKNAKAKNP
jgi:translation initiation factor IF-3